MCIRDRLYDTVANRISIEDVQTKDGRLRLMENVWWEYDKLPHMLIAGGTGSGKTYFILTLIEALLRTNAVQMCIRDRIYRDYSLTIYEIFSKGLIGFS